MTRKTSAPQNAAALTARRAEFSAALLGWYRLNARRLPWREAPSLYKTVTSEFMLQQTQVKTVLPDFARWHAALPDFAALAAAPEAQVLKLWKGLGYYSRARNLHRLGKAVAALPARRRTPAEWEELPRGWSLHRGGNHEHCVQRARGLRRWQRRPHPRPAHRRRHGVPRQRDRRQGVHGARRRPDSPGTPRRPQSGHDGTRRHRLHPAIPSAPPAPCVVFALQPRAVHPSRSPNWRRSKSSRSPSPASGANEGALLLHRTASDARRLANQHELPTAEHVGLSPAVASKGLLLATKKRGITRYRITESIHSALPPPTLVDAGLVWVRCHRPR